MTRTAAACFFYLFLGVIATLDKNLGDLMPRSTKNAFARCMDSDCLLTTGIGEVGVARRPSFVTSAKTASINKAGGGSSLAKGQETSTKISSPFGKLMLARSSTRKRLSDPGRSALLLKI